MLCRLGGMDSRRASVPREEGNSGRGCDGVGACVGTGSGAGHCRGSGGSAQRRALFTGLPGSVLGWCLFGCGLLRGRIYILV